MKVRIPTLEEYTGIKPLVHHPLSGLEEKIKRARRAYERLYPGEKYVMLCNDFAGLELRIMTFYSRDKKMSRLLSDPEEDVHLNTAETIGVARNPTAKEINFLVQF